MRIQKASVIMNEYYAPVLIKDFGKNYSGVVSMLCAENVVSIMNDVFNIENRAEEFAYLIALNTKLIPLYFFELSHGTCNSTLIGMRELFVRVLLCGAAEFILVHNHPSGKVEPSDADYSTTEQVNEGAKLLGLHFRDHIIVARDGYFSFCKQGLLQETNCRSD